MHQMSILESESTGEGTPQGVVLALVSIEDSSPKEQESMRMLRMYNLSSLISLAKYYSTQKVSSLPNHQVFTCLFSLSLVYRAPDHWTCAQVARALRVLERSITVHLAPSQKG